VIHAPNRNYVWTYTFVQALADAGLRNVVIAPGSRSTPLTMAFARHPDIRVYSHIDERGAAFMALGLALAQDAPSAVVCSSGTAAANFFPAIVEAHYAHVPLLVLTADRPHELRESGANQTVDQVKLYGDHVLWSVDVALPEANPPDVALRNLRSLAARAFALADGMPKGAVHLNFPFRKPLEPTEVAGEGRELVWGTSPQPLSVDGEGLSEAGEGTKGMEVHGGESVGTPFMASDDGYRASPRIERGTLWPTFDQSKTLLALLADAPKGLIICGPRCPATEKFRSVVSAISGIWYYPLLVDPLSGIRGLRAAIGTYNHFLREATDWGNPDIVIHFGAMPVSQVLDDYLNTIKPKYRVVISDDPSWTDANHNINFFFQSDPYHLGLNLCDGVWYMAYPGKTEADAELSDNAQETEPQVQANTPTEVRAWTTHFASADSRVRNLLSHNLDTSELFDGNAVYQAVNLLPENARLFVASSLAVRHLDQFGGINKFPVQVFCNRGASGIDGTISSAIGVAATQPDKPTVLIIGDLAFYHDMNALLAAKRNGIKNLVIVLLNNNGGQIFRRLPINQPEFEPEFTELFITPHGMTFEHTAAQFGFAYARADDREGFRAAFATALASGEPSIVEVVTDAEEDAKRRKALMDKVAEALKGIAN
jgi:2-succinyl-5-enolpyruvyl-6-hydroxy-3-cyclohexene-1-carboxylate synthase